MKSNARLMIFLMQIFTFESQTIKKSQLIYYFKVFENDQLRKAYFEVY